MIFFWQFLYAVCKAGVWVTSGFVTFETWGAVAFWNGYPLRESLTVACCVFSANDTTLEHLSFCAGAWSQFSFAIYIFKHVKLNHEYCEFPQHFFQITRSCQSPDSDSAKVSAHLDFIRVCFRVQLPLISKRRRLLNPPCCSTHFAGMVAARLPVWSRLSFPCWQHAGAISDLCAYKFLRSLVHATQATSIVKQLGGKKTSAP